MLLNVLKQLQVFGHGVELGASLRYLSQRFAEALSKVTDKVNEKRVMARGMDF